MTETSAAATRSMVLATLSMAGAAVIIDPSTVAATAGLEPAVVGFELVKLEGAGDDQAELVDVDRLLVEIIGAEADRPQRAFVRAVAGGDDDLGVGLEAQDFLERGEPLGGAVGIGRQAEVERDDVGFVRAQARRSRLPGRRR